MRRIENYIPESKEKREDKDFFVGSITPIGMDYINLNNPSDDYYGAIAVMFMMDNKMDDEDVIYVSNILELQNQYEFDVANSSLFCTKNWDDEFREKQYKPVMAKFNAGTNYFLTDFEFTKTGANGEPELSDTAKSILAGVTTPKPDPYYTFLASAPSEDMEYYTIRKVHLNKGQWLQLSQFLYWIMMSLPIAPNIFAISGYKNAKMIPVNSMFYDGCTDVNFLGQDTIMAHFTLYFNNTLDIGNQFGFNIPVSLVEDQIVNKYVESSTFVNLYSKDDTVGPDRVFMLFSPEKLCCLLTGDENGNILIFTLTPETADKVDWMNWGKYIYLNEEKETDV